MLLAEANLVNHLPAILSRMPLAEANLVIHIPVIPSWMPLAEANSYPGNPITDVISRS